MKKLLTLLLAVTCVCGCSRTERPIKDNQSNFGKDIGYQYGTTEGTIEIYQNEKWRIFATEDVREQIQSEHKNDIIQTE